MIEFYNVNKVYEGGLWALRDLTLSVKKGEFVFLTGASGAGKTTLLKLLYVAEKATDGQVLVFGRNVSKLASKSIPYLRRNIGVVFQDYKLLKDSNIYDNVAFALRILGKKKKEIDERVFSVLEMVGLSKRYRDVPDNLSGGEQQRVCIARAIVNNPPLVLADEPTGNLDPDNAQKIMQIFKKINSNGSTVIFATHDLSLMNSINGRNIHLKEGKIVKDGVKKGEENV
ncbi:MAG: cell division ATP-binding protein FtsE [Candidatus Schekmanbacteria bacterium]|nr:MAG: cell division ATP-binding protein FtsE [Candidatus Schekmanbacteria bacterium]